MNARTNAKQVQAYFLIDRTGGMVRHLELIQTQLNRLLNYLKRDGRTQLNVQLSAIVMNLATCQVIEPRGNWFQLPLKPSGCDLGEALRLVEYSLRDLDEGSKVELFVLLKNEPAGNWKARIKSLKAHQAVRATVLAFGSEAELPNEILREIRTWPSGAVRSRLAEKEIIQLFNWIFELLKGAVESLSMSAHAPTQGKEHHQASEMAALLAPTVPAGQYHQASGAATPLPPTIPAGQYHQASGAATPLAPTVPAGQYHQAAAAKASSYSK